MNRKSKHYAAGGETDEKGKADVFKGSADPDFESTREVKRGESESTPKRASVTKEQLEKSGLSLRDYMNKERGLSRRDGEAPKAKAEAKPEAKAETESKADKYSDLPLNKIGRAIAGTFKGRGEPDKPKAESKPEPKSDKYSDLPLNRIGRAISGTFSKGNKAGGAIKMASGGKTSSASSRGDGIAVRGKTKGRMI